MTIRQGDLFKQSKNNKGPINSIRFGVIVCINSNALWKSKQMIFYLNNSLNGPIEQMAEILEAENVNLSQTSALGVTGCGG